MESVPPAALPRKAGPAHLRVTQTGRYPQAGLRRLVGREGSQGWGCERPVRLPGLLCDAGLGSLEAWTRPLLTAGRFHPGLVWGEGARGSLMSGVPRKLRAPPPAPPPSFWTPQSEGAARLLGRTARPLSSPCPPCPREVGTREAPWPQGPFPSISSEAGGLWGSCRGVREGGIPAHHDGGVPTQRHPHSAGVGLGCLSAPGVSRGSDPNP